MNDVAVKNILTQILEKKDNKDLSIFQGLHEYKKYYITEQLPGRGPSSMTSMSAGGTGGNVKSGSVSFGGGAGTGLASPRKRQTDLDTMISGEPGGVAQAAKMLGYTKLVKGAKSVADIAGKVGAAGVLGRFGPGMAGIFGAQAAKGLGDLASEGLGSVADILGGDVVQANVFAAGQRNIEGLLSQAGKYGGVVAPKSKEAPTMLSPEEERRKMLQQKIQDAEMQQKAAALGIPIP